MPRFMLLIRGGNDGYASLTPEQAQQTLQRHFDWSDKLRRESRYESTDELKVGGRTVRVRDGQIVIDGPYVETKESVGGYYMIHAAGDQEAAEIARECPVLAHGGLVEVRQIYVR